MCEPSGAPLFHVALHEPLIPNNTGNIGRTCLAMGAALHLIEPLGFDLDEKAVRRAGLDYWPRLNPSVHPDWDAYEKLFPDANRWYFEPRIGRPHFDTPLRTGDQLVFGKETGSLPDSILDGQADRLVSIPLRDGERSLNLANAVCVGLAEGTRQLIESGDLVLPATP
ncbi:MAG: tRNA (cytidine(34)-2'-O)-methyltransferase [Phycisphaerales bacterium]